MDLRYPFTGRWLVQNSPADRVPSHGTTAFATSYAIDFVPVDDRGRTAPFGLRSLLRPQAPDAFPGFRRAILAPVDGVVVAAHGAELDHAAYRGLSSVGYAVTQGRRVAEGWLALAGNHVLIRCATGDVVALCHLQQGSVSVRVDQPVRAGDPVGRCGNSGNSTEPHVHVQAIDRLDVGAALPVPITFDGGLPRGGEIVVAHLGNRTG
ncbi:M23 family metallopeptidase [Tessaracoccus flavus]|uniref:Peptidase n=1 Tax=Tessaracoccus flavus TaxID=1610493 RepID=A0A1Q2CG51_9ACTN|nr:M23 family metallopeptidase [Tessaracoccus flavus]AQP45077.1 peptidase [Tessaracoccus flavus]SDY57156.1 Peptidase family M23 [Tessaracoccus flavus]